MCAGACGIACAPILVRLSETGPVASAFWRAAVAAPVLCLWARRAAPRPISASLRPAVAAGLFFAADLAVWHWSIIYTSVANATLLANLAPIFVTLASWFFFRKRVTRPFLVGMMSAIAGMFVLVRPNFAAGGTRLAGDALGALTAVFYAGYMLAIKTARDAGISTLRLMAWSTSMTAVALLPAALFSPQPLLPQSPAGWANLGGARPRISDARSGSHCLRVRASLRVALEREPALTAGPGDALCLGAFQRNNRAFTTDRRGRRARGNLARAAEKLAVFRSPPHAPLRALPSRTERVGA